MWSDYGLSNEHDSSSTQLNDDKEGTGALFVNTDCMENLEPPEIPSPTFPRSLYPSSATTDLHGSSTVSRCRDIRDIAAVPGVTGLQNLGNTCFMNSGLQCLLSNAQLARYFLEEFEHDDEVKHTLTGKFSHLLHKYWSGRFSLIFPSDFKKTIGFYHPQFRDHRQHDCQEFLALLLDSLHEHLNQRNSTKPICDSADGLDDLLSESDSSDLETEDGQTTSDTVIHNPIDKAPPEVATFPSSNLADNGLASGPVESVAGYRDDSVASAGVSTSQEPLVVHDETSLPSALRLTKIVTDNELEQKENDLDDQSLSSADVARCRIPSIEDFCSKDNKTRNTNVLQLMETSDGLAVDSDKFHKPNNVTSERRPTSLAESIDDDDSEPVGSQLQDYLSVCDGSGLKPCKDSNLVANCRDKLCYTDFSFTKTPLMPSTLGCGDLTNGSSTLIKGVDFTGGRLMKQCFHSSVASEADGLDADEHPDINNIKRIKIDDQAEKNLRMQTKLKVNTEQNRTRSTPLNDCSAIATSPTDVLLNPMAGSSGDNNAVQPTGGSLRATLDRHRTRYIRSAQKAWREYVTQNRSVIVATFQGQFKSTVVCSDCNHVSVTFEPFMYLSVPLPHALERQISIIFVPCDNKQPVRYLLTLHRQDTVKRLRGQLVQVLGEDESCDLTIAEVLDHHVARVLEDPMMVKAINDSERVVYAFEMLPPPSIEEPEPVLDDIAMETTSATQLDCAANNTVPSSTTTATVTTLNRDINNDCFSLSADTAGDVLNNRFEAVGDVGVSSAVVGPPLESHPDVNWHHNELGGLTGAGLLPDPPNDTMELNFHDSNSGMEWSQNNLNPGGDSMPAGVSDDPDPMLMDQKSPAMEDGCAAGGSEAGEGEEKDGSTRVADQWKACVICLEEMEDSQLLVHAPCKGFLCQPCLELSFRHTSRICPVCQTAVNPATDFIQLNCMDDYKPKTRMLSVPIVNRCTTASPSSSSSSTSSSAGCSSSSSSSAGCSSSEPTTMRLFGHPNMLYLPSKLTGQLLYQTVDRVVPYLANYSIVLTDGQGLRCSRCLYTQHCTGCELPRDSSEISLQPGDHLAVHFTELTETQINFALRFIDHTSMQLQRSSDPLTLYDCFDAFAESELLDEHNPWYCPKCRKNQCASKTMSVWRYPDTLIVQLKRFVYHELSSTKIDNKVVFPLEGFDLANYISGPKSDELVYDLQSCVCHFGGANSGHYTAYARHAINSDWFYSNDETVVRQTPHDADFSNVYILFYQRRGTNLKFELSRAIDTTSVDDNDSNNSDDDAKPHISPINSTSDLMTFGPMTYDTAAASLAPGYDSTCPEEIFDVQNPVDKSEFEFYA